MALVLLLCPQPSTIGKSLTGEEVMTEKQGTVVILYLLVIIALLTAIAAKVVL